MPVYNIPTIVIYSIILISVICFFSNCAWVIWSEKGRKNMRFQEDCICMVEGWEFGIDDLGDVVKCCNCGNSYEICTNEHTEELYLEFREEV